MHDSLPLQWNRGISPTQAFEHFDDVGSRRVTRLQFKEALVEMGFVLVDDPLISLPIVDNVKKPKKEVEHDILGDESEMQPSKRKVLEEEEQFRKRKEFEKRIKVGM